MEGLRHTSCCLMMMSNDDVMMWWRWCDYDDDGDDGDGGVSLQRATSTFTNDARRTFPSYAVSTTRSDEDVSHSRSHTMMQLCISKVSLAPLESTLISIGLCELRAFYCFTVPCTKPRKWHVHIKWKWCIKSKFKPLSMCFKTTWEKCQSNKRHGLSGC